MSICCGIGVALALVVIFAVRQDLIVVALASAAMGMVVSLPCYWLIEWLLPGFIRAVWDLPRLSGILLAGIPIEDLAWYAYSAALFGTYDKYAAGQRLVRRVAQGDYPSGGPL
jgi:ACR3 family arsenite efflux pump ArsB